MILSQFCLLRVPLTPKVSLFQDWRGLDRFVGFRVRQEDVQLDGPLSMMTKSKPVFSLGASVSPGLRNGLPSRVA